MKWAERPQSEPAPASNHSSLSEWGSSHGPIGFKSWITFLFLSLSNYLHPLTCSVSLKLCMARFSPLHCNNPSTPTPTPHPLPPHSITAAHGPHCTVLYRFAHWRHQSLTPTTYSSQSHLISRFPCLSLSRIVSPSFSSCAVIAALFPLHLPLHSGSCFDHLSLTYSAFSAILLNR